MLRDSQNLTSFTDARIMYALADVHTSLPCKVIKYYHDRQAVDIQPLLRKKYSNDYVNELPTIQGVPLIFQGASTSLISFPINEGDIVLAIFCERSIDTWVNSTGNYVTPPNGVLHDLSDCFAIAGLQTFRTHENPNPDNLEVRFNTNTGNECSVKMYQNGDIKINSPTKITLTASASTIEMDGSGVRVDAPRIDLN